MTTSLPWTAKDIFRLSPSDWLRYHGLIQLYRLTGLWRYPIPASGDIETMSRRDLIYWLYKAQFPIERACKGSGLEAYFEKQRAQCCVLPANFVATSELTLSAVGDLMDHPYLPNSAGTLYADNEAAELILGADVAMANLECVIYPQGVGTFTIRPSQAPPLYYSAASFNAVKGSASRKYAFVATACNHSLDCGEAGVASTIRTLRSEGIAFNGVNESAAHAVAATLLERNGVKLGLISHTFGLNAKKPPVDKPWLVNRTHLNGRLDEIDFSQIERQIQYCRDNSVDAIVAHLHWGMEHEYYPRPEQLAVAHHLAELGVDVVIGHHPHVVQPMEPYRTKRDPERVVPIYYSLGNLVNPFSHPAFRIGGVAQIRLAKGASRDGTTKTYVSRADLREVFQEIDAEREVLRLVPYRQAAGGRMRRVNT